MAGWEKWPLAALIAGAAMLSAPAAGSAVTVTLGPPDLGALVVGYAECPQCQSYGALNTTATASTQLTAPADGTITSWAAIGATVGPALHLLVFKPQSDGTLQGGTLSPGGLVDGTRNSTSQP